jgi:hypothetical protein
MSGNSVASTTLKLGSYVSIALGPLLSTTIPMAPDVRKWAFWFSAVVSAATLAWMSIRLSDATAKRNALRDLLICSVTSVIFAFAYIAINLFWTIESGDFHDVLWQLGLIGTFGIGVGCITGALVALERVTKSSS